MNHTPKPWTAKQATSKYEKIEGYWLVTADNGVTVADLFGETGKRDEDGEDVFIPNEEAGANAHLIAAAPDLLVACKFLIEALEPYKHQPGSFGFQEYALLTARDAIDKAQGES